MTVAATNEGWNADASLGRVNRSPFNAHSSPGRARPAGLQSQPAVSRTAGGYSTPEAPLKGPDKDKEAPLKGPDKDKLDGRQLASCEVERTFGGEGVRRRVVDGRGLAGD